MDESPEEMSLYSIYKDHQYFPPEKDLHWPSKSLKVDQVIKCPLVLDVAKDGHPNDGVDEGDEGQQGADVEQGRQGDDEGKEELSDPFCSLDQSEYPPDPEHPDHSEQGGGDGEVGHEVLHEDSDDGGDDEDKVKEVPGSSEVVVPQTDDLHRCLCNQYMSCWLKRWFDDHLLKHWSEN